MSAEVIHLDIAAKPAQDERSVDVIASTPAIDAYGEVVLQDWDLTRYLANPVVFYNHDPYSLPIGFAENVRVEDDRLRATIKFVDASANPIAEQVYQGFRQGSLRAVSVGFRSKNALLSRVNEKDILVLSGNELMEISAVPLPANPEAVAHARAKSLETVQSLTKDRTVMIQKKLDLVQALAVQSDANDDAIVASAKALADVRRQVLELCGAKSMDEAYGTLKAWQSASKALPELEGKVKSLEASLENQAREDVIREARQAKKLTPALVEWAKSAPLETLKSFVAAAPTVAQLSQDSVSEAPSTGGASGGTFRGKSWGDLKPMERADLKRENPALYDAMRTQAVA